MSAHRCSDGQVQKGRSDGQVIRTQLEKEQLRAPHSCRVLTPRGYIYIYISLSLSLYIYISIQETLEPSLLYEITEVTQAWHNGTGADRGR